ncbi:hypothetical protein V5799_006659 [Amblyomma americanum]|uniref:Protein transport protein sec16 n=1 Tax=Amblyomma americanum TaxID=6943 RepID=A0AAQ4DVS3_AMBAM
MSPAVPCLRSSDILLADPVALNETEPPVCSEDRTLLAASATHVARGSEESKSSAPRHHEYSPPTRLPSFDQCSTVSGSFEPTRRNRDLKIGDIDSEPRVRRRDFRAGKTGDDDPTCYRYVEGCKNSSGAVPGDGHFLTPTGGRGSDEIMNPSEILSKFDLRGSRRGKGDFQGDQEQKRECQHVRPGCRRGASGEGHERDMGSGRRDVKDSRAENRRHSRHEHYEDRTHRTELSTNDHGKSGYCKNSRYQRRRQESYHEWKEQRSGSSDELCERNDYRYEGHHSDRHSDYPSYHSSLESSFERQSDGPHRYRRSDFSPPDLRRGYGVAGRRKHRDDGRWRGTLCDQKGYGKAGGYNYPHYDYPLRSGYDYAYFGELYRTNPTYRQQVDAYYTRIGYRTPHQMHPISLHADLSFDYRDPRLDNSSSSSANYYCDPRVLDHEPRLEEVKKFSRPHPLARFCGVSGLLKLVPTVSGRNVPQPVEIHSLRNLFRSDPQFRELQAFPGPLVKSETHKDNVLHFCKDKIRAFAEDPTLPDRSSRILLWELLLLMVRQNGFVSGSDLAELLVREHEPSESSGAASVLGNLPWDKEDTASTGEITENCDSAPSGDCTIVSDLVQFGSTGSDHTVSKFREFLLYGRTKRALDWAAKHGLWGHALCLASKMDTQTYAATVTRFTNSLAVNDPLRTLYQHLSGRQPTSVTCAAAERWGDWRPHLAMILSNPSSRPEANTRSIVTLGDALASRGCLSAAHFCYLAAQVEFGSYACKSSKLVLLGSCHRTLSFREFASNDAIQATEIYEYARSLADTGFTLPHLQPYKFLLAMRLAEYGFAQEALQYCEVLAEAMTRHCWSAQLATETYELASRLKYHDAHCIQELEELGEPPWLAAFSQLLQKTTGGTVAQAVDGFAHDNGCVGDVAQFTAGMTRTDSLQNQLNLTTESSVFSANESNLQQQEKQFGFHVSGSAYWNGQAGTTLTEEPSPMLHAARDDVQQPTNPPSLAAPPFVDYIKYTETDQHWNSMPRATHDTDLYHPTSSSSIAAPLASAEDAGDIEPQMSIAVQPSNVYDYESFDHPFLSIESHAATLSEPLHVDTSAPSTTPASTEVGGFDYKACTFSGSQPPQYCETSQEHLSNESVGKNASDQRESARHSRQPSPQPPAESSRTGPAKDQGQAARKKRWLMDGIMGAIEKLVPKGPNQMILPDDTEPEIVWDEQKKCWVDKNAAPGELASSMAAPPTDSSFGNHPQNTGENRFQMNRQRRRRYVDVQNVGGNERPVDSTASASVAPFLLQPAATQAPPQFFVPCVSEQQGTGCDFVSPPSPPRVQAALPPTPQPPPSESPVPDQPRAQPTRTLTFSIA